MSSAESKIYHLSPNQLRALLFLCQSQNGIVSSTAVGPVIGLKGKNLGGVFSSLSRQVVDGQNLVLPWGKSASGRGLRWKLNTNLITIDKLSKITRELLA